MSMRGTMISRISVSRSSKIDRAQLASSPSIRADVVEDFPHLHATERRRQFRRPELGRDPVEEEFQTPGERTGHGVEEPHEPRDPPQVAYGPIQGQRLGERRRDHEQCHPDGDQHQRQPFGPAETDDRPEDREGRNARQGHEEQGQCHECATSPLQQAGAWDRRVLGSEDAAALHSTNARERAHTAGDQSGQHQQGDRDQE
jgi:hypothetical protein